MLERTRFEPFAGMIAKIHRRRERQAQAQSGGLIQFVRYFWHVLEPQTRLVEGWALEAVCKHLEAVTFGEIKRLLVNVPPGFMKSLLTNVFWPAWSAIGMAHTRYACAPLRQGLLKNNQEISRYQDGIIRRETRARGVPNKATAAKADAVALTGERSTSCSTSCAVALLLVQESSTHEFVRSPLRVTAR